MGTPPKGVMICESGLGERHWMREAGSVYVYSYAGREAGELVACRRCAGVLAADPDARRVEWATDADGTTLTLRFPSRASRRFPREKPTGRSPRAERG